MKEVYVTFFKNEATRYYESKKVEIKSLGFFNSIQTTKSGNRMIPSRKITNKMSIEDYTNVIRSDRMELPELNMATMQRLSTSLEQINVEESYDIFKIPKKSGGFRTIKSPMHDLKTVQSTLKHVLEHDLKMLPHQAAYAYTKGRSVYDAVAVHQTNESKWFLKIDLENFFDNTSVSVVRDKLVKLHPIAGMENKEALLDVIEKAAFLDGGLPQGTPLSPTLTNLVMMEFDHAMTGYAYENALRYTRYADDLIISSKYDFNWGKVVEDIKIMLYQLNYDYTINSDKTRYGSSAGSNWNLGLMLNKDNEITIGHKEKKRLKNSLFNFHLNQAEWDTADRDELNGQLEWLRVNEPEYYLELISWFNRKHNTDIIQRLRKNI